MTDIRDEKVREQFQRDVSKAEVEKAYQKSGEVLSKVEKGFLHKEFSKIKLLVMMLRDYWNEVYTEVPWHTIAALVIILLYILNPIDLIPDFIPVAGQADDLAVLYFGWKLILEDVKTYAKWKVSQGDTTVAKLFEEAFQERV